MNIGDIENVVASYLQQSAHQLIVGGQNLIRIALNNARKRAERMHDWVCEEVQAYGVATDGKGSWRNLKEVGTDEDVKMKQPTLFYMELESGVLLPLIHTGKKVAASQAKEYLRNRTGESWSRYRGDLPSSVGLGGLTLPSPGSLRLLLYGNGKYQLDPAPKGTVKIVVEGYKWLDDYEDEEDEDFFTEHGAEYLQWAAIAEVNHRTQTFIPQQEGNLSPPEKARDNELASLITFDGFIVDHGADLK